MSALLSFAAALVSLRLAAELVRRARRAAGAAPELLAWAASLFAYALAAAALAGGAAGGWHDATFRVYYLFGGLLTVPLLAVGSLLRRGLRWPVAVGLLYTGLAVGVAIAMPVDPHVHGSAIPRAQEHVDVFPARALAIAGNSLGTLAVIAVAVLTIRRRPLGNGLIVCGVVAAAVGSAFTGVGEAATAALLAAAAALLYAGVVSSR